jgi:hypothetical protein
MRFALLAIAVVAAAQNADEVCNITGRVTRASSDEGLRKATVALMPVGGTKPLQQTGTDLTGQYCFSGVVPGLYRVSAEQAGFQKREFGARKWQDRGTMIVLEPDKPFNASIELFPLGGIRGRVTDYDGDVVPGTRVTALRVVYRHLRRNLERVADAECDELGEYKLANLPAGRYVVRASPRVQPPPPKIPGRPQAFETAFGPTFYPAATDAGNAITVDLEPAMVPNGIDISLRRAQVSRIRGQVLRFGQPAIGATVVLGEMTAGAVSFRQEYSQKVSDTDGSFDFRGVWGTQYLVQARDASGSDLEGTAIVDAMGRDVDFVIINLGEGARIEGNVTVKGEQFGPLRMTVEFEPVESFLIGSPQAQVSESGKFQVPRLRSGRYWVRVTGFPEDAYVRSVRFGNQELSPPILEVRAGGMVRLEIDVNLLGGKVSGRVQTPDGKPAASAAVALIPDNGKPELFQVAYAFPDGAYILEGLPPGGYQVVAVQDLEPGAEQQPDFLTRFGGRAKRVDVPDGGTVMTDLTAN